MPESLNLKLISSHNINDNTVHFEFQILDDQSLELVAGQFVRLLFEEDGQEAFRSYSIANILNSNKGKITTLELAVSWVAGGLATKGLASMKIGDSIKASAPYGRFCLTGDKWRRYFLVATGTGVTPYRAMTNELKQRIKDGSEIYVIMGARDPSGLLYSQEFRENSKLKCYNYITCLSREYLDDPTSLDLKGHVQTYLKQFEFNADSDIVYLCGNPAMVDDAYALLKDAGLPTPQIRREKYVSPPKRKKKVSFEIKS